MKKTMLAVVFLALTFLAVMLGGCGEVEEKMPEVADEAQMLEDVQTSTVYNFCNAMCEGLSYIDPQQNWKVTELVLNKRKTDEENGQDVAYCSVKIKGTELLFVNEFKLVYNYYDVGGWVLDEIKPQSSSYCVISEIDAAYLDASEFPRSDMLSWDMYQLQKHNFNLENQTDVLTYRVDVDLPHYVLQGEFTVYCRFLKESGWIIEGVDIGTVEEAWDFNGLWCAKVNDQVIDFFLIDHEQKIGRGLEWRGGQLVGESHLALYEYKDDQKWFNLAWATTSSALDKLLGVESFMNATHQFTGNACLEGLYGKIYCSVPFDENDTAFCDVLMTKIATLEEVEAAGATEDEQYIGKYLTEFL